VSGWLNAQVRSAVEGAIRGARQRPWPLQPVPDRRVAAAGGRETVIDVRASAMGECRIHWVELAV
jgi:hypothetical protein